MKTLLSISKSSYTYSLLDFTSWRLSRRANIKNISNRIWLSSLANLCIQKNGIHVLSYIDEKISLASIINDIPESLEMASYSKTIHGLGDEHYETRNGRSKTL